MSITVDKYNVYLYNEQPYLGSKLKVDTIVFDNANDSLNYRMPSYYFLKEVQYHSIYQEEPSKKNPNPTVQTTKSIIQRVSLYKDDICALNFAYGSNGYFRLKLDKDNLIKAIILLRKMGLGINYNHKTDKNIWIKSSSQIAEIEKILSANNLCSKRK